MCAVQAGFGIGTKLTGGHWVLRSELVCGFFIGSDPDLSCTASTTEIAGSMQAVVILVSETVFVLVLYLLNNPQLTSATNNECSNIIVVIKLYALVTHKFR